MASNNKGTLYLCATPIGNLEDITLRTLRILEQVDLIAAEDTRRTIKLLNHFEIRKQMTSYHENNKRAKGKQIIELLIQGKEIALVSDAGTPGISDPGQDLVKLCIQNNISVTALPGPVAATTALILSGLSTNQFSFEGFLSVNKRDRKEHLNQKKDYTGTLIFYEAPHKLNNTLKDLLTILGNRKIAIARELTKKFEEVIRGTIEEVIEIFTSKTPRGEFVIIVEGADEKQLKDIQYKKWTDISIQEHINIYISEGIDSKEALKKAAKDRGISKRDAYTLQLKEKNK